MTTHTTGLRAGLITASVRQGRFGPVVSDWFAGRVRAHGAFEPDVIDLAGTGLPLELPGAGATPPAGVAAALGSLSERLSRADAFVVITPEYNRSYPASLKNAIDWTHTEWQAKPVAFVSYGGLSGGLRAVEHLRPVFAEMHAVTIRETVSFHTAWEAFDAAGQPAAAERSEAAAIALLDQLAWWARALADARAARPYAA